MTVPKTARAAIALACVATLVAVGVRARRRPSRAAAGFVTGRAQRTARVAKLSARASADFAAMRARSAIAPPERREEIRAEFELRSAEQVAEVLGDMKGALMK